MQETTCIYGEHSSDDKYALLLNKLRGNDSLLFALTEDGIQSLEEVFGYSIRERIVDVTIPEVSFKLLNYRNTFHWFKVTSYEEIVACIEDEPFFFMGCIVEVDGVVRKPKYVFDFIENLKIDDELDCGLIISGDVINDANEFIKIYGGYRLFKEKTDVWVLEDGDY